MSDKMFIVVVVVLSIVSVVGSVMSISNEGIPGLGLFALTALNVLFIFFFTKKSDHQKQTRRILKSYQSCGYPRQFYRLLQESPK